MGKIIKLLGYRKFCARWVACTFTAEMEAGRQHNCWELLQCLENDGKNFCEVL
jgi:hypothetical protein